MIVDFSPDAWQEVVDISDFLAQESPSVGARFLARIQGVVEVVGEYPESNRVRADLGDQVRIHPIAPWVVAYRIRHGFVEIVAVPYGGRDLQTALRGR